MIKVAKFGGSSLSDAKQIDKVAKIILNDQEIRYVIVSAPGKTKDSDKFTDLLINLANLINSDLDYNSIYQIIINRLNQICLDLKIDLFEALKKDLDVRISHAKKYYFADLIKAYGEDCSAKILANYLGQDYQYIDSFSLGMLLDGTPGDGRVNPISYHNIEESIMNAKKIMIIPGFYGYDKNHNVITFGRGGSDVTAAIIANAVKADLYENYTDVDSVLVADPRIIDNPSPISEITYDEMRELSYAGFNVLHEETIIPLYKRRIPINIKNTNNPTAKGTQIISEHKSEHNRLIGIAGTDGFTSIYLRKYLMNREVGYVRKLLQIFEEEGIPFEHTPSGIDYISVILDSSQFYSKDNQKVIKRIKEELSVDSFEILDNLAMIVIVNNRLIENNILAKSSQVLKDNNIQLLTTSLTPAGKSLILGIHEKDLKAAVVALYNRLK